jgi:hypothetical protein
MCELELNWSRSKGSLVQFSLRVARVSGRGGVAIGLDDQVVPTTYHNSLSRIIFCFWLAAVFSTGGAGLQNLVSDMLNTFYNWTNYTFTITEFLSFFSFF